MKENKEYIQDIAEMRSMMERSSKFLSLSGMAGIMAGIYALAGAFIAYRFFEFETLQVVSDNDTSLDFNSNFYKIILLAVTVLILAIGTAIFLSQKKANKRGEKLWNPSTRRLLVHMFIPLAAGGILILIMISKGLMGFVAPMSLLFYGLALFAASKFTYEEVRSLGMIEIALGLLSSYFIGYGLLFWAFGFGIVHIVYGIYMHYRYER